MTASPAPPAPATPAMDLWEQRFTTGWRGQKRKDVGTWVLDDLWRAACWERTGLEHWEEGHYEYAERCFEKARRILGER